MGSESKDEFEEKPSDEERKLFDSGKFSNPSWRSWSLTINDFRSIGRWFEPFLLKRFSVLFFWNFFRSLSWCPFRIRKIYSTDHIPLCCLVFSSRNFIITSSFFLESCCLASAVEGYPHKGFSWGSEHFLTFLFVVAYCPGQCMRDWLKMSGAETSDLDRLEEKAREYELSEGAIRQAYAESALETLLSPSVAKNLKTCVSKCCSL